MLKSIILTKIILSPPYETGPAPIIPLPYPNQNPIMGIPEQAPEISQSSLQFPAKRKKIDISTPAFIYINGQLALKSSAFEISEENEDILQRPERKKGTIVKALYKKAYRAEKWSEKEIDRFYKALQVFGTDFSVVAQMMPGRNRTELKVFYSPNEYFFREST